MAALRILFLIGYGGALLAPGFLWRSLISTDSSWLGFLILASEGQPALWVHDPGAGLLPTVVVVVRCVARFLIVATPSRGWFLITPRGWGSVGLLAYIRNGIGSALSALELQQIWAARPND